MEKVTLQTIADKLQVSKALVSKGLSNHPAVNEVTKELIRKTADELGYRVKKNRKMIPAVRTGNVAVIIPRGYMADSEYWGKVIQGIDEYLSENQISMIVSGIDTSISPKEGMPSSILEQKVDGAIIMGHIPESYIASLKRKGLPVILVDYHMHNEDCDHVLANNFWGAYQATRTLLDAGHRFLAFVGDNNSAWSFQERQRGFVQAIEEYNAAQNIQIEYVFAGGMGVSGNGNYVTKQFPESLKDILLQEHPVTGVFCANDMIAIELLNYITGHNLSCPKDVSIIGYDNLVYSELAQPKLSTVNVPKVEMGARASQMLLRRMECPDTVPELVMLSTEVLERASVRKK